MVVVAISGSTPIVDITGTRSGQEWWEGSGDLGTKPFGCILFFMFHLLICKPFNSFSLDYCMSVYNSRLDNCNYFLNMFMCLIVNRCERIYSGIMRFV